LERPPSDPLVRQESGAIAMQTFFLDSYGSVESDDEEEEEQSSRSGSMVEVRTHEQ
jgi:hypothetical protein